MLDSHAGEIILKSSHHILDIEDGIVPYSPKTSRCRPPNFFLVPGDAYPSADLSAIDEY
jgi:hypothetical protein